MTEKKGESLQEQMKNLQGEIGQLYKDIDTKKRELTKLKNENTLRQEKINWIQEKITKMKREKKSLEVHDSTMSVGHPTLKQSTKDAPPVIEQQKQPQQEINLEEMQMLEFFNQYLDQTNKQMVKFQGNRNRTAEKNEYINPYPTINIKHLIEGIEAGESSSFRLDQSTTFAHLKELAFYYWGLAPYLRKYDEKDSEIMADLELTDENHARIELREKVIDFFTNRGVSNLSQITLLLQRKKDSRNALNSMQIDSIKINGGNKSMNYQNSFTVKKNRIKTIDTYNLFFEKFPGLKYYISELQIQKEFSDQIKQLEKGANEKEKDKEFEIDDMNCLIISLIVIILVLTIISYMAFLSPYYVNLNFTFINNLIGITNDGEYLKVTSIPELYFYMETFLAQTMYNSDKGDNPFRSNFEMIGGIQLRQLRSPLRKCDVFVNSLQEFSCFDIVYDSNTAFKDVYHIPSSNSTYQNYTAEELGILKLPSGNLTTYTDGGYIVEFNRDITSEAFLEKINDLRQEQFLDKETAVIFIDFVIYNPSINLWIQANFMLERNAQNKLSPYKAQLTGFKPNVYYGDEGQNLFRIDMVKLIMACILLTFVTFRFYKIKNNTGKIGPALLYVSMEIGFFNIGVGVITVISVAMSLQQSMQDRDPQELVDSNEFVHLELEADLYKKAELFLTISIMFLFLRLSYILKLNDRIAIIFLTYSKSFKELLPFLAIEFPLFLGFVMVFQIIYGNVFPQYASFTQAIASQLTMIQGQLNITQFINYSPIVSMIVILFYYFFMLFFIISLFQAILIECFRIVIMKNGYPQDKDQGVSIGDLFSWMFSWTQLFISKKSPEDEKNQQQEIKPQADQEEKQAMEY